MNEDIAIRVDQVSKNFLLPHEKVSSLKSIFTHLFSYITKNKSFETQRALHDISLEIKKGEFFGIVGRNGSGKSTLLKIIAGIYQPSKGKVYVNGKLVPFIELGVGFNPELTGRQNVYLNGAILGFSEKEVDALYDEIVEFAELEPFMDQKLKNYSSGMQVRLAFSMAVRAKADILLIDEVLAVGDADFQRKCFDYFKKLKKDSTTVVFVSHNMDAVREYCDRAILVEDSEIIKAGATNMISEEYLRLFMQKTTATDEHLDSNRWGDQSIKLDSTLVEVDSRIITINEAFTVVADIQNPIVGFRIRNAAGENITGTNTKIEQKHLGKLKPGEKIILEWKFPNFLSDGEYFIDPAILHDDGITVCDWWNDAAIFTIKKRRHLPYVIDPGFDLKLTKAV